MYPKKQSAEQSEARFKQRRSARIALQLLTMNGFPSYSLKSDIVPETIPGRAYFVSTEDFKKHVCDSFDSVSRPVRL